MQLVGATLAITGIGGFIGRRMAERARERGLAVRGLDADERAAAASRAIGFETACGDVRDEAAARALARGSDVLFHTAAVIKEAGPLELFREVNVRGTENVVRAAREAGVRRLVHLSSVMVYGFDFPADVDEKGPRRGEGNPYCQTKIESEDVALGSHGAGGLDVVVIRPGDVYGPGSEPWVLRPLRLMRRRQFFVVGGGRGIMNHVYVDNLLDAVFAALERDATGEAFNVTDGARTTWRDYWDRLARAGGLPQPPSLPAGVLRPLAAVVEAGARVLGRDAPFSSAAVSFVCRRHAYAIDKAKRVLGYAPRVDLDEGMERVAASLGGSARAAATTAPG